MVKDELSEVLSLVWQEETSMSGRKPSRKTLIKKLDTLCARLVKLAGKCEDCGVTTGLQCAHGFSRRYMNTRFLMDNLFCLCKGCHFKYTVRPLEWDDWLKARWGARKYQKIRMKALSNDKPDLEAIYQELERAA